MTLSDPASRLEHAYRRLLRWYPATYRAEREQEMLGTLCEMAEPGQAQPTARERASLLRGAVRAHVREAGEGLRGATAAATVPIAALVTGYLVAVWALIALDATGLTDAVRVGSALDHLALAITTTFWLGIVVSVLLSHTRSARVFAAAAALTGLFAPDAGEGSGAHTTVVIGALLVLLAPALRPGRSERLAAGRVAALVTPVCVVFAAATSGTQVAAHSRQPFLMELDSQSLPIGMVVALVVAVVPVLHRAGSRGLLTALLIASATAYTLQPINDLLPRGSFLAATVLFGLLPVVAKTAVAFTAVTAALSHLRRLLHRPRTA
ncbi:hypothetical protein OG205_11390 [Lentzea sp. NBC_00516]|uniref:hypothetical protein n=1 Tax=Lentzea sp. NBC_00516 TaxID=2903582 RepID=UPI002E80448A|nr:hypothetical protein [Lentzea sp. NBC_00516]WUD27566.1 hypothetical protein OG205_11390 [Lentzea sp. NBC_00516]